MEWDKFLFAWGPALPLLWIFFHFHKSALEAVLTKAVLPIQQSLEAQTSRGDERHEEHLVELGKVRSAVKRMRKKCEKIGPTQQCTCGAKRKRPTTRRR